VTDDNPPLDYLVTELNVMYNLIRIQT